MTCNDVHPGQDVIIESWCIGSGLDRKCTVKFMAENYWMPDVKHKLSYNVIKKII